MFASLVDAVSVNILFSSFGLSSLWSTYCILCLFVCLYIHSPTGFLVHLFVYLSFCLPDLAHLFLASFLSLSLPTLPCSPSGFLIIGGRRRGSVQLIFPRFPLQHSRSSLLTFIASSLNTFVGFQFCQNFLLHQGSKIFFPQLQPFGLWRCHHFPVSPISANSASRHHLPLLRTTLLPFLT